MFTKVNMFCSYVALIKSFLPSADLCILIISTFKSFLNKIVTPLLYAEFEKLCIDLPNHLELYFNSFFST